VSRSAPAAAAPAVLRTARPDLEVRRLIWQLDLWPKRWRGAHGLDGVRRDWQLAVKAFGSREEVESVDMRTVDGPGGGVTLRIYTPATGSSPRGVLAWIHGGGFIAGDLYTAGGMCRALANRSGAIVVAVGYRRAPEHPLETARADCLAAVRWLAEHAAEIGGDPRRLAVGGDSAGGALAAAVAHDCGHRGGPPLCAQVLVYPATDLDGDHPSLHENARGYLLTRERIEWIRSLLSQVSDLSAPGASPLDIPDLRGLPPAVVVTAGFDPLRDEGLAYVRRLREAGVPVELLHYPGEVHGFMSFDRVLLGARDAVDRVGSLVATVVVGGLAGSGVEEITIPWPRGWQGVPWLHPGQRWRETTVACLMARDQVGRRGVLEGIAKLCPRVSGGSPPGKLRSMDVSGNLRTN
jgi:acetyl esterase